MPDTQTFPSPPVGPRYGEAAAAGGVIPTNPVLDLILSHRSVRQFADRALPEGLVELLAAAAQSAPSSSNLQAMSLVAVEDSERKARLAALAGGQRQVAEAPLLLLFVADLARLRAVSAVAGEAGEGLDYTEMLIVAVADAAFAAQNALLALQSIGLGGCYIGAMRNHPEAVAAEAGLPAGSFVAFGMTVGYPDPAVATAIKPRLPRRSVLHREQYVPVEAADIAAYDGVMAGFRGREGLSDVAWSQQAARRVRDAGALSGRHVLRGVLERMGLGVR